MTSAAPDYSIAVVVRTLDLLETLAAASAPLGPTELAARLGTTKSAAHRILATLELRGYMRKDPATARYRLGTRLAYLSERSLAALDLRRAARAALESLYQRFHETVNLGVREGQEIVYIDMIESDQASGWPRASAGATRCTLRRSARPCSRTCQKRSARRSSPAPCRPARRILSPTTPARSSRRSASPPRPAASTTPAPARSPPRSVAARRM
jgi:DNA-binding MarR family transcriptional regulator